nr:RimK family protein [Oceanococcus sp. HetDA_MAG_MS8]
MSRTFLVVDDPTQWGPDSGGDNIISFAQYLAEHPIRGERKTRIINLCSSLGYLSTGYYCSLLAEARGHRVLPSVNTLNDLRSPSLTLLQTQRSGLKLPKGEQPESGQHGQRITICLGQTTDPRWKTLSRQLFERFPAPLLQVEMHYSTRWDIRDIRLLSLADLDATEQAWARNLVAEFSHRLWRSPRARKLQRWDLALLVNPEEQLPPSDEAALKRIEKAAEKVGFAVERIHANDYARVGEFDALFIRETTAIDHHTYQFARKAEIEGLVVMDDPTSILRCCNKVFLQDAFSYNRVPTLGSRIVDRVDQAEQLIQELGLPLVLKIPDGSFSRGVCKVETRQELERSLKAMLQDSALVLAQEYLYTEFDWRIGVLNHRPLYACKYFMARNHWQIYAHSEGGTDSGGFTTLATFETPKVVLDAALRAARMIGDGLYGIDIKQHGSRAYVIEVNDNPSLDQGIEDAYLGQELYMQIMSEFARRLERRGRPS